MVEETKKTEEKIETKPVEEMKKQDKKPQGEEQKVELEREYIVPLRKGFMKVQRYQRAKRALSELKQFIAKHMKVEDRDIQNVKIDKVLNEELWFRGIKRPMHKIKVKAKKINGIVYVELSEPSDYAKFKIKRMEKRTANVTKTNIKPKEEKQETTEEKTEEKEKEAATAEEGSKHQKAEAKKQKHSTQGQVKHEQKVQPKRMSLQK